MSAGSGRVAERVPDVMAPGLSEPSVSAPGVVAPGVVAPGAVGPGVVGPDVVGLDALSPEVMAQLVLVLGAAAPGGLSGVGSEQALRVVEAVEAVKAWRTRLPSMRRR